MIDIINNRTIPMMAFFTLLKWVKTLEIANPRIIATQMPMRIYVKIIPKSIMRLKVSFFTCLAYDCILPGDQ